MHLDQYPIESNLQQKTFVFYSTGPRGVIKKIIKYEPLKEDFYNLAFGDWDEVNQKINDQSRSNNGDYHKILATVADSVRLFLDKYPNSVIFAEGFTAGRTRLFQMAIRNELILITKLYRIQGLRNFLWEDFHTGKNYDAFAMELIKKET